MQERVEIKLSNKSRMPQYILGITIWIFTALIGNIFMESFFTAVVYFGVIDGMRDVYRKMILEGETLVLQKNNHEKIIYLKDIIQVRKATKSDLFKYCFRYPKDNESWGLEYYVIDYKEKGMRKIMLLSEHDYIDLEKFLQELNDRLT